MAFAPSTWVPCPSHSLVPAFPFCPRNPPCSSSSTTTSMVMEKPYNPNGHPNAQLENLDAIHNRLGIVKLWDSDIRLPSPSTNPSSSLGLPADAATCHIPVVGDKSSQSVMPWDTTTGAQGVSLLGRRMHFLRKRQQILSKSYEECRRITALFSKTFYMGTTLLSPEKQRAVWAIYTWCRRTDDLVDGPRVTQRSAVLHENLKEWQVRLDEIFKGGGRDALDLAMADAISCFSNITPDPFRDMISGMVMDVDQDRFETFDDLYLYCYRVAGTVGLMTLPVMGTVKPGLAGLRGAVEPAVALGIGLQLTNILRDVGEDRIRGRIYLPLEDLKRFNYTEEDLFNCVLDNRYRSLMKFEIARARRYFRQARKGVPLLSEDSRLPVQASLDMYSQILNVLEENNYDNFNRRAYITKNQKLCTVLVSYLRSKESPAWKPALKAVEFLLGFESLTS